MSESESRSGTRRGRSRRRQLAVTAAVTVSVLMVAAGCSSASSSSTAGSSSGSTAGSTAGSSSAAAYKVGLISDLTGAGALLAAPYAQGAEAALDLVNSQGGVNGHKLDVITFDTQSDPTTAQAVNRQAIGDKPVALLEATGSSTLAAAFPLLQSADLPVLGTNAIGYPNYPWLYGASLTLSQLATSLANSAIAVLNGSVKGKKAALVGIESPATQGTFASITSIIKKDGGTVTSSQFVAPGSTSFASGAANVVSQKPNIVIIQDSAAGTILEAKAIAQAGFTGPIVVNYGGSDDGTLTTLGNPNVLGVRPYVYATPGSQLYGYAKKFGQAQNVTNEGFVRGWLMAEMLIAGLGKCSGTCNTAALESALNGLGSFTVPGNFLQFGDLYLSASVHHPLTAIALYRYSPSTKTVSLAFNKIPVGPPGYSSAS
jgi:branched-chain amino acid transport system substrate-binding protein